MKMLNLKNKNFNLLVILARWAVIIESTKADLKSLFFIVNR